MRMGTAMLQQIQLYLSSKYFSLLDRKLLKNVSYTETAVET